MIDIFSYSGKGVLPIYTPGVSAYGQKGAPGNTGDNGASVHFSSYDLSVQESIDSVKNQIRKGVLLSNNIGNSTEENYIEYHNKDLILDITGNFYRINISGEEIGIERAANFGIYSQSPVSLKISDNAAGFQVGFETDFTENVSEKDEIDHPYLWRQNNPYYMDNVKTGDHTGDKIHDGYYSKYIYGNFLKYELSIDTTVESDLMYKFYVEFPTGEVLDTVSYNQDTSIFIENTYCFSCVNFCTYTANISEYDETSILMDIRNGNTNYTLNTETVYNRFGVGSPQFSALVQMWIKDYCNVYVDVIDLNNGSVYRFDYKEARLSKSDSIIFRLPRYAVNDISLNNNAQNYLSDYKIIIPEIEVSRSIKGVATEKNENNTIKRTTGNNTSGSKGTKRKKRK